MFTAGKTCATDEPAWQELYFLHQSGASSNDPKSVALNTGRKYEAGSNAKYDQLANRPRKDCASHSASLQTDG
jgi:hypothetical protein